jgi:RimJ/RimL family protein N-acetyltransferase
VLVGDRLYLRMFTPEDGALMRDASLVETEFRHEPRFPRSALRSNVRFRQESEQEPVTGLTFAIVLRDTGELIGRNELDHLDLVHRSAETGTELFRAEHRGKGYGTEAKHLLLRYAFDVLHLHMVWAIVWEENPRSRAALQKQGYRLAGCTPWRGTHHGVPSGDWNFDLLASEWHAARARSDG